MIERHLVKLRAREEISPSEEQVIRSLIAEERSYPADMTLIERGKRLSHSTLLLDGFLSRCRDLRNGERQITHVHVAGDFADLHSFTLAYLDHSVMTLTPCRVAIVPHDRLRGVTEAFPHLTRTLWFSTNLDAAIHREWEVSLGRRHAVPRAAHFFCELHMRLAIVGLGTERGYEFPVTQHVLAECLGLTPVHVNRTLRELRERGLMTFRRGRVELKDLIGLRKLAEFDPTYLYIDDAHQDGRQTDTSLQLAAYQSATLPTLLT